MRLTAALAALGALLSLPAHATTYTYQGNDFNLDCGDSCPLPTPAYFSATAFFNFDTSHTSGDFGYFGIPVGPVGIQSLELSLNTVLTSSPVITTGEITLSHSVVTSWFFGGNNGSHVPLSANSSSDGDSFTAEVCSDVCTEVSGSAPPGTWVSDNPAVTPIPPALPLFATGLGAVGLVSWLRKRKEKR